MRTVEKEQFQSSHQEVAISLYRLGCRPFCRWIHPSSTLRIAFWPIGDWVTEKKKKAPTVAILIRNTQCWPVALQATKRLQGSGADVTIFILCIEQIDGDAQFEKMMSSIKKTGIQCYVDQPAAGMACMPLEAMAKRLRQFELVIPI
jgi:hypothetical protein